MKKRKEFVNKKVIFLVIIIILAVLLLTFFFLPKKSASSTNNSTNSTIQPNQITPKQECESKGGRWARLGGIENEVCNLPTNDANKSCSSSKECEGDCLVNLTKQEWNQASQGQVLSKKGNCTEWKLTLGCRAFVEDSIARIMCVG